MTILVVAGIGFLFLETVDLAPKVSADFFFSSNDPAVEQVQWIQDNFASSGGEGIFLSVASPEILTRSESYVDVIRNMTDAIVGLPGVAEVISITRGPKKPEDALERPLWSRVLVDHDEEATLILVLTSEQIPPTLVPALERIAAKWSKGERRVRISGTPFVAVQIARALKKDFQTFTLISFGVFGLVILLMFRSIPVLLGTLITCGAAIMLSLIVQALLGGSIGILTANLATIVFVLTQSHIIFLTSNQRLLSSSGSREGTEGSPLEAVRKTLPASCWCMLTTLLGFASLLLVEAEPLRELGRGGTIGTALAIACAYSLYPPFLGAAARSWSRKQDVVEESGPSWLDRLYAKPMVAPALGIAFFAGLLGGTIAVLDTDPPLLEYFDPKGDIYDGLEFIDRTGGTSLLQVVVRDPEGGRLDTREAYDRMWSFQERLEDIPEVGATVSLPVLLAEARAHSRLAFLLGPRKVLNILSGADQGGIGNAFATEDRLHAMFLMRMREADRKLPRSMIIEHMGGLAENSGLEVRAVGSIFFLQGRLSELVAASLFTGLAGLLGLFFIVSLVVSRSPRTAILMTFGIALVPLGLLGGLSTLRIPVDVISSPAANVCIGMGADAMIHLVSAVRRQGAGGPIDWNTWVAARREQGFPILVSSTVVCAGFAIFAFSSFPPNQRFGLAVVFGTLVAAAAALIVVPVLAGRPLRK